LLGRGQTLQHLGAQSPGLDLVDELLDHLVVDVGLEQGQSDLAGGSLHVFLSELALPAKTIESGL
jgi:hypothetical protein